MRDHHLIPQAMMNVQAFMAHNENAGISNPAVYIHLQMPRIPNAQYIAIHDAGWNSQWKIWFKNNLNFNVKNLQGNINILSYIIDDQTILSRKSFNTNRIIFPTL